VLKKKMAFRELTQTDRADASERPKGEEENRKKQKHQKIKRESMGPTINLVVVVLKFVLF